jgi:UDP-3-O-[3-hydroxymyristoyl] glucosamine N-acyltransferase
MADPRFFDNRGPFVLSEICAVAGVDLSASVDRTAKVFDVAGLAQAGPQHLSFFVGARAAEDFATTRAGWCLVGQDVPEACPKGTILIASDSVAHSFAMIAAHFYPDFEFSHSDQSAHIDPSAQMEEDVVLAPGVVVGPGAEIGSGTRIGANTFVGRGVAIGRRCQIGSNVSIQYAYLGDDVIVQPGAVIGGAGFGFASGPSGHMKIPQLGRVIVQDRVEIGAGTAIDRGALTDTVIGEGTKIDNLVQIGHNVRIGRNCIIVAQVGLSGSVTVKDYAVLGGKVGVADHITIGEGTRIAAMSGVMHDLEDGKEYAGVPARTARRFFR